MSNNLATRAIDTKRAVKSVCIVISIIIAATAIISMIIDQSRMTPSLWLTTWIGQYERIFFWIIDGTVGRLVSLFDFEITPLGKNIIVLYSVFGAALGRRMYKTGQFLRSSSFQDFNVGLSWWIIAIAYIFWPVLILIVLFYSIFGKVREQRAGSRRDLKGFMFELIIVGLAVGAVIVGEQVVHYLPSS